MFMHFNKLKMKLTELQKLTDEINELNKLKLTPTITLVQNITKEVEAYYKKINSTPKLENKKKIRTVSLPIVKKI